MPTSVEMLRRLSMMNALHEGHEIAVKLINEGRDEVNVNISINGVLVTIQVTHPSVLDRG